MNVISEIRSATELENSQLESGLVKGRRFRVIKEGASFGWGYSFDHEHRPIPVGAIIQFRRWLTSDSGDLMPIWAKLNGRVIWVRGGTMVYNFAWAVFRPWIAMTLHAGESYSEGVFAPDPSYMEPIDADGSAQPW